jgi:hypothetical protein
VLVIAFETISLLLISDKVVISDGVIREAGCCNHSSPTLMIALWGSQVLLVILGTEAQKKIYVDGDPGQIIQCLLMFDFIFSS